MKLFFFISILFSQTIHCQEYDYKEFGQNEGLPSNQVYDIYQSKNNTIWLATDRGIASYNGYEFKTYGINDGLLNICVLDFFPQDDGKIYCNTIDNQLFYFNDEFNGFYPYKYSDTLRNRLKHYQKIKSVYKDSNNNFSFSSEKLYQELTISNLGIVNQIQTENREKKDSCYIVYHKKTKDVKSPNFISLKERSRPGFQSSIFCDSFTKDLEVYSGESYNLFKNTNHVSIIDNKTGKEINRIQNNTRPLCAYPLSKNLFFIGYLFGGGKILNIDGQVLNTFIPSKSVTHFLVDTEGGYWFTTLYSGVFYLKNPEIKSLKKYISKPIASLSKNKKNELLIGYENGSISVLINNNKETFLIKKNNNTRAIIEYNPKTKENIFYTKGQTTISSSFKNINTQYLTKFSEPFNNKTIAIGTNAIEVLSFSDSTYKLERFNIPFRAYDACFYEKKIYICSSSGIYYLQNNKLEFLGKKSQHFNYRADDIDLNVEKKEFYIATLGNGLVVYNKITDSIYNITEQDGLYNNIVNEIYIENKNDIWVCTNSGLNKIHFSKNGFYQITGINHGDGLLNNGVTDVEIINDTVWIGSKKGLIYVPKSLFEPKSNNINYRIEIKRVKINDSVHHQGPPHHLSHLQNKISFFVETISQKIGQNVNYKYRLAGLEKSYQTSQNREIIYSSIPPGEYVFEVQPLDKKGEILSEARTISFTIYPPFWKTWRFNILITIIVISIIYLFFKLRILSYNKNISGELMRLLLKQLKRKEKYFVFKNGSQEKRIKSNTIYYVKSDGNYLRIFTKSKTYLIRGTIANFISTTSDPLEFLRIHRSYIIRIDKVESKSKQEVIVLGQKIPVSGSYEKELGKLFF